MSAKRKTDLLSAVEEVARSAGAVALKHFRRGVAVENKDDGTPVTVADRSAEDYARKWIAKRYPRDAVVGEEFGGVSGKRTWIIDPIDGTKAFIHGVPIWGTMVAVCEGTTVLASAIAFPALRETIAAARGKGTHLNGVRCRVSTVADLSQATVLTTEARPGTRGLARLQSRARISRTWGDCYGYLLVASGRAEVMVDPVLAVWDSAPLQPLIEEAGGVFTDYSLAPNAFGGSAIATNKALADEVRGLLIPPKTAEPLTDFPLPAPGVLVAAIAQDADTGEVLMVAHADAESIQATISTGIMHYHSRRRGLWRKGETSGNLQDLVSLHWDCDRDALLALVRPRGPACHELTRTCFANAPAPDPLSTLARTIAERAASPAGESYTQRLLGDENLRLKKIGEESAELLVALARRDSTRAPEEAVDLLYHLMVALHPLGVTLDDIRDILRIRASPKKFPLGGPK